VAAKGRILQRRMGVLAGEVMLTSLVRRKRLSSGSHGKDDRFEPTFTCVGQESIHDVRGIGEDTEARPTAIVGGLSVALARTFRIIEPS
jgi:Domain of unknown function (DUF1931)